VDGPRRHQDDDGLKAADRGETISLEELRAELDAERR